MFLKDHLKDTYQKASFDNNHLMLENIINVWAHRFGPESLNELFVKNKEELPLPNIKNLRKWINNEKKAS